MTTTRNCTRAKPLYLRGTNSEFIAGGDGNADSCYGDSGGPVYATVAGKTYLVGTTSRGRREGKVVCGSGTIYTRTSAYADWIWENAYTQEDQAFEGGGCSAAGSSPASLGLFMMLALIPLCRRKRNASRP